MCGSRGADQKARTVSLSEPPAPNLAGMTARSDTEAQTGGTTGEAIESLQDANALIRYGSNITGSVIASFTASWNPARSLARHAGTHLARKLGYLRYYETPLEFCRRSWQVIAIQAEEVCKRRESRSVSGRPQEIRAAMTLIT